jgi:hypothetical protein
MKLVLVFLCLMVGVSACGNQMPVLTNGQMETATPFGLPPTWTPDPISPAEPTLRLTSALGGGTRPVLLIDESHKDGFPTDAAKITAITLEENILRVPVVYQGGCREHTFELQAETAFLQSYESQGILFLSHDSHEDTCTEKVEKLLSLDLTPLNKERNDPRERPLLLRIYEPVGGSFAKEPYMPLIEWP